MVAFTIYIAIVWYYAALWRRRRRGFVLVGAAFGGLVLLAIAHLKLRDWTDGAVYLPLLQGLLYPYAVLVLVSGLAIASLPARREVRRCRACAYELTGLGEARLTCPECGCVDAVLRPPPVGGASAKTLLTYGFGGSRAEQA